MSTARLTEMASEHEWNVKFVLEVGKNACLYNYTLQEYGRKDLVKKAWTNVGKKVNLTGPECKVKWRNLRSVFVQNLKPMKSGSAAKKRKPYYLNEVMQFTVPFIRFPNSSVSDNLTNPTNPDDFCIIDESSNEEDNTLLFWRQKSTEARFQSLHSQSILRPLGKPQDTRRKFIPMLSSLQIPTSSPQSMTGPSSSRSFSTPRPSKKKGRKSDYNIDDDILQYKAKQPRKESLGNIEQNPKKMFLLSLLPDVEPMSDGQMREFKRRVVQVIEEIFDDRPSKSSMENSELAVFYENITPIVISKPDDSIVSSEPDDSNSEDAGLSEVTHFA